MPNFNPTPPLVGGNFDSSSQVGFGAGSGYMFQSGNVKPEVSGEMTWLLDQFYGSMVFDKIGRNTPINNTIWEFPEMNYLRQNTVVTDVSGTGGSTTSRAITTTTLSSQPYFYNKMTLMTDYNVPLNVDSVNNTGTYQVLTVYLQDQTNDTWTGALGVAGAASGLTLGVGHLASSDAEFQDTVDPSISYPIWRFNRLNLLKRNYALSRDATKVKTWAPDGTGWYYQADIQMMKNLFTDRDMAITFHKWDGVTLTGKRTGNGIFTTLKARGTNQVIDGAVQEDDIQDLLVKLMRKSSATEYFVACGSEAFMDVNRALRPYALQAMTNPTIFKGDKLAGVPFNQYVVAGKVCTFVHWPIFDNDSALPYTGTYAGTATSGKINFRSMMMFLNMGSDDKGNKLISLKHLEGSNLLLSVKNGTVDITGKAVTDGSASFLDGASKQGLMDIAPEVRNAPAHGLLYRMDA